MEVLKEESNSVRQRNEKLQPGVLSLAQVGQWNVHTADRGWCSKASSSSQLSDCSTSSKFQISEAWGMTTTPALETLQCIQKVKQAIVDRDDDDSMSSGRFAWLVGLCLVAAVAFFLFFQSQYKPM